MEEYKEDEEAEYARLEAEFEEYQAKLVEDFYEGRM